MVISSTFSGFMPRSMEVALRRLRRNSVAPTSSTSESATWVTTRTLRNAETPETAERAGVFLDDVTPGRTACERIAGASPKTMPVTMARIAVKTSTRPSGVKSKTMGIGNGSESCDSARVAQKASTRPNAAPASASSDALGKQLRDSRERLAPMASRMPISFCLAAARASSRFATFAQAISSTRPTTTIMMPASPSSVLPSPNGMPPAAFSGRGLNSSFLRNGC